MKLYRSTPRTRLGRPAESRKHTSGCRVFLPRERGVHCDENGQNQNSMAERFLHLNQLTTVGSGREAHNSASQSGYSARVA
jgi:hypothetical protein